MDFWTGFIIGFFAGGGVAVFVIFAISLMVIAKQSDVKINKLTSTSVYEGELQ